MTHPGESSASALLAPTYWEQVAETRWGAYITEIERRAIEFASSIARPIEKAVEIGCEGGRWSKLLSDLGWGMTCIDVDEKVLQVCRERIPEAVCLLSLPEATSIPCETTSLRLALCVEVRPVMRSSWFFEEITRVLLPGGLVVGVVWNNRSLRGVCSHINSLRKGKVSTYTRSYSDGAGNSVRLDLSLFGRKGVAGSLSGAAATPSWFLFFRAWSNAWDCESCRR